MVKYPLLNRLVSRLYPAPEPTIAIAPPLPVVDVESLSSYPSPARYGWHDGESFPGGFGLTDILALDYWTLRARSTQLFRTNTYARGITRRFVTNIVNAGLHLEAVPDESILGLDADTLADWAELTENRWSLWARSPALCDYTGQQTFGEIQATAKLTALISGDVLVVLHQDPVTGLPKVRLVSGSRVQSPFGLTHNDPVIARGHTIKHGVELDSQGRHVAYWVTSTDETTFERTAQRLPAVGPTGRRAAWLVYGTDKLLEDVRGEPILSIMLQGLREIHRYRDAVQRKAAINAILAMFIRREHEGLGTRPLTSLGGARVKGAATVESAQTPAAKRTYNFTEMIPGAVLDELAPGEEPKGFVPNGTDEKFGDFEAAIVYGMSWCLEIPPEILTLSFRNNYAASQAAINEFKLFLNPARGVFGNGFCQPIYVEWLLSETLRGRIQAPGFLDAWRDPALFDKFAAWTAADWTGAIKPSVDLLKQANGYEKLVTQGFISRDRAARETTGTKFSKNVAKLRRENEMLAEANAALPEAAAPPPKLSVVRDDSETDEDDDERDEDKKDSA